MISSPDTCFSRYSKIQIKQNKTKNNIDGNGLQLPQSGVQGLFYLQPQFCCVFQGFQNKRCTDILDAGDT